MSEIKELLNEYRKAKIEANMAEDLYVKEPENKEKEKMFDEAYRTEFSLAEKIADKIVEMTDNGVTKKLAREMVWGNSDRLERIFNV